MRCYWRLPNISYKDHVTNEEVRNRIQYDIGVDLPNHGKETENQMVWPLLKILWHGEDNSAGNSERSKKARKTEEEMGRKHHGMDSNGVWRFPEGSRRQGRVERYWCNVICGAPANSEIKGLR